MLPSGRCKEFQEKQERASCPWALFGVPGALVWPSASLSPRPGNSVVCPRRTPRGQAQRLFYEPVGQGSGERTCTSSPCGKKLGGKPGAERVSMTGGMSHTRAPRTTALGLSAEPSVPCLTPSCPGLQGRVLVSCDSCCLQDSPTGRQSPCGDFALFLNSTTTCSPPAPGLTPTDDESCAGVDFTYLSPREQHP